MRLERKNQGSVVFRVTVTCSLCSAREGATAEVMFDERHIPEFLVSLPRGWKEDPYSHEPECRGDACYSSRKAMGL